MAGLPGILCSGGLIGLVVDFANGAAYHLSPTPVEAALEAQPEAAPAPVVSSVPPVPIEPQPAQVSQPSIQSGVPATPVAYTPTAGLSEYASQGSSVPSVHLASVRLQPQYDRYQLFLQPRVNAERLTRVSAGVWLQVIEARPQWLYVQTPDERRGWILQEWVQQ
jgi:hypothetical protein